MSTTLAALRQEIGVRTGQPFFTKFSGAAETASAAGTTTTLIDTTALLEADNYWRGHYIYFPGTQETRQVSAFANATSQLTWLSPIAGATGATTTYELWSTFSPIQVHNAINIALRDAYPYFFEVGSDVLVLCEDWPTTYDLPTDDTIRRILRATLLSYPSITGTTTSDALADNQIVDTNQSFDDDDILKAVSIYNWDNDCAGEYRIVEAVPNSYTLTVDDDFSDTIVEGSKYRLSTITKMPNVQVLSNFRLDRQTYPTMVWFGNEHNDHAGDFVLFEYEYDYAELSAETSATDCLKEYVILSAIANLYLQKLATAPATEVRNWEGMQRAMSEAAQKFALRNRSRHNTSTVTQWFPNLGYSADYPFSD